MYVGIYPGCADDIKPIILFPNIQLFIYIDTNPHGNNGYFSSKKEFIFSITSKLSRLGFILFSHINNIIIFKNLNRFLIYFYNTSIENALKNNILKNILNQKIFLISIGFCIHKKFLSIFKNTFYLITSSETYISNSENTYHSDIDMFLMDRKVNEEVFKKIIVTYYINSKNIIIYKPGSKLINQKF